MRRFEVMAKELYYFEDDDLMTFQGHIYSVLQDPGYHRRTKGWIIIPDDAVLEGL